MKKLPGVGKCALLGSLTFTVAAGQRAQTAAAAGAPPDRDVQLALRLKVQNRQITEAEHLIATIAGAGLANLQTPRASLLATVPPAERLPRDMMREAGLSDIEN